MWNRWRTSVSFPMANMSSDREVSWPRKLTKCEQNLGLRKPSWIWFPLEIRLLRSSEIHQGDWKHEPGRSRDPQSLPLEGIIPDRWNSFGMPHAPLYLSLQGAGIPCTSSFGIQPGVAWAKWVNSGELACKNWTNSNLQVWRNDAYWKWRNRSNKNRV